MVHVNEQLAEGYMDMNMTNLSASYRNIISSSTPTGFSLLLLLSFLSMSSIQTNKAIAAVDVDTEGDGRVCCLIWAIKVSSQAAR